MGKGFKERIAYETLMILIMLIMFSLITSMWPLIFLVFPVILIAALRLLFLSVKRKSDTPMPTVIQTEQPRSDTEQDVIRAAFGILQRRVTEQVTSRYPAARWVWELPNAIERFSQDLSLTILLNRAGGFRRATVQTHNLQFCGLVYADSTCPDVPPPEIDADGDPGIEDAPEFDDAVDYALIAFQWVETNLLTLNSRCNNAIAEGQTTMLIPASDLPYPDSWSSVCNELTRNGFTEAVVEADGISVVLPQ